jgi:hypothetical protein
MVVVAVGKAVGEIVTVAVGTGDTVVPGVEGALVGSHAPKRDAKPVTAVKMMIVLFISLFYRVAIAS